MTICHIRHKLSVMSPNDKPLVKRRKQSNLTQVQLAKKLNSSQSRIAKMEQGDPKVSLDLLVKPLMAMGATKKNIVKLIA